MTDALVTGATGLVGFNIVETLLRRGRSVRAMVRDPHLAAAVLPEGVEVVQGDVTESVTVAKAVEGCAVVYHAAGLPEQWLPDPAKFNLVNVIGTQNVVDAVLSAGRPRLVYTSTIDVFRGGAGEAFDESEIDSEPKGTYYERSKQDADRVVVAALEGGLDTVFVHPSAVYGPGPAQSPGLNAFFERIRDGKAPALLPGAMPVVYARDVGEGHVLAAEKANPGERFILSERTVTLLELAEIVVDTLGRGKVPRVMPLGMAKIVASIGEGVATLTKRPPLIPKGQLTFMQWCAEPTNAHAREKLGLSFMPLAEGVAETLRYLSR
jgi:dihydroflavonol-4-reductase